jgi:hypothetical protein
MSLGLHEVIAPDMVAIGWPQSDARAIVEPQPLPSRLFLRHFQSFSTPQSFHAFVIHLPPLVIEQRRNSPVAIPPILCR